MKRSKHFSDPVRVLQPLQSRVPFAVVGYYLYLAHGSVLSEFALPGMLFVSKYYLENEITALAGGANCVYAAVVGAKDLNTSGGTVFYLSVPGCIIIRKIALPQYIEHLSADGAYLAVAFGRNVRLYLDFAQINQLYTQSRVLSLRLKDGNAVVITAKDALVLGVKTKRRLAQSAVSALFYRNACFLSSRDNTLDCLDLSAGLEGVPYGSVDSDGFLATPEPAPLNSRFLNTYYYQMAACGEMALCIGEQGRLFAFNLLEQQAGLVFDAISELHVDGARVDNIIQIATFSNFLVFQDHEMTLTVVPLQTVQSVDGAFYARSLVCVSAAFGEVLAAASFERFVAFSGSSNKLFLMDLAQYHEDLQREALMLRQAEAAKNGLNELEDYYQTQNQPDSLAGRPAAEPEAVDKAPANAYIDQDPAQQQFYDNTAAKATREAYLCSTFAGRTALAEAYAAHAEVITHVTTAGGFLFSASRDAVVIWQRRPWATLLQGASAFCQVRQADFVREGLVPVVKLLLSDVYQITAFDVCMGKTRYTMALGVGAELWTLEFYGLLSRLARAGRLDVDGAVAEEKDVPDGDYNQTSVAAQPLMSDDFCAVVQAEFVKTTAHTDYVNTVLFLSHELLVSGSADKSLALWNVSHAEKAKTEQQATVYDIFTNKVDRKRKLSIQNDETRIYRLYDLYNASKRTIWHVSRWGSLLCVSSGDKKLRVVKVADNYLRVVKTLEGFQFALVKAFFINESQIISLQQQGIVTVTNVGTGEAEFVVDARGRAQEAEDLQFLGRQAGNPYANSLGSIYHPQPAAVEFGTYTLLPVSPSTYLIGTSRGELLELSDDSELLQMRAEADSIYAIYQMQAFNESINYKNYAKSVLIAIRKGDDQLLLGAAYRCLESGERLELKAGLGLQDCYFVLQVCCKHLRTARRSLYAVFLLDFIFRQVPIYRLIDAYGEPCRLLLRDALRYAEKHRERVAEMRGQARVI